MNKKKPRNKTNMIKKMLKAFSTVGFSVPTFVKASVIAVVLMVASGYLLLPIKSILLEHESFLYVITEINILIILVYMILTDN